MVYTIYLQRRARRAQLRVARRQRRARRSELLRQRTHAEQRQLLLGQTGLFLRAADGRPAGRTGGRAESQLGVLSTLQPGWSDAPRPIGRKCMRWPVGW